MTEQNPAVLLAQLIHAKEIEHQAEGELLKAHFSLTYESLKPINILKSTVKEAISSPELKTSLVDAAIGMTAGMIAKKVFAGNTHNPLIKLAGMILETVVSAKVAKHAGQVKSLGSILLEKMIHPKDDTEKA